MKTAAGQTPEPYLLSPYSLSIVIPSLNEAQAIPFVTREIFSAFEQLLLSGFVKQAELIVVDDGSTDESIEILAQISGPLKVIRHETNQGYGAALKSGFAASAADYIGFMDMDLTYDACDLPAMFKSMIEEKCDLISGSRLHGDNGMPKIRRLGNHFFTQGTRLLFANRATDVSTGFRIFHRSKLDDVLAIAQTDLSFSFALTLRAVRESWKTKEHPIRYRDRAGSSKLSVIKDGLRFLGLLLNSYFSHKSRFAKSEGNLPSKLSNQRSSC